MIAWVVSPISSFYSPWLKTAMMIQSKLLLIYSSKLCKEMKVFSLSNLECPNPLVEYSSCIQISWVQLRKAMMMLNGLSECYCSYLSSVMMGGFKSSFSYTRSFSCLLYCGLIRKVLTSSHTLLIFSTTYSNYTLKGHPNSHIFRVYKYPCLASIAIQVRVVLNTDLHHLSFQQANFSSGYHCVTNTPGFFFWGMASSPRAVLDPSFQCEAAPICLVQRSSSNLENALRRTLAGRLLTAKKPSIQNLTLAASRLWNCIHRLSVYDHGKCLYSFEFSFLPDVERVVSGGPWYINGDLLLISRMDPCQSIEQLSFSYTKLWVRCFDLPPMCFTKEYAEAIGNSLGKFCETDLPPEDPAEALLLVQKIPTVRKYLRVKFEYNLYGPLKSTQSIKIFNEEKVVVAEYISRLTYERLPYVCLRCGFLGHLIEGCSFEGPQLYGEWIRAENFFRGNAQNFVIPKAVSTAKEGLPSSSSGGTGVTQVSNLAELVNTMINDPDIVKANFNSVRAEGPLPVSKGKAPLIDIPQSSSLVPYNSASPPKSVTSSVLGTSGDSIMGTVPAFLRSHTSPMGSDLVLTDSDEGQFASYLNSIASHDETFTSNANRCLFKSDAPFPVGPTNSLGLGPSSPKSILNSGEVPVPKNVKASAQLSEVFKDEIRRLPIRKRAPGNPVTPRPKRGRQSSNMEEPG